MDTRDGKIYTEDQVKMMSLYRKKFMKPMVLPPTTNQKKRLKVGRNDTCPCGSGFKFKKCCWSQSGQGR